MLPKLLDLFCGAGGSAMGYHRAGFDVVGVDRSYQRHYPFDFILGDALEFLVNGVSEYDVIHTSPPCQGYSTLQIRWWNHGYPQMIPAVRTLLEETGKPYVIENVEYAPLQNSIKLCGSMFDELSVLRHRNFESNIRLRPPGPCDHERGEPRYTVRNHGKTYKTRWCPVWGRGGGKSQSQWKEAMGIDWMTRLEIVEAIPPPYTQWIGQQLMEAL